MQLSRIVQLAQLGVFSDESCCDILGLLLNSM